MCDGFSCTLHKLRREKEAIYWGGGAWAGVKWHLPSLAS